MRTLQRFSRIVRLSLGRAKGACSNMTSLDPEIQRIIDSAEPGVLDVIRAYENYEASYMASAHVPEPNTIVAAANTHSSQS
jgi:hypothetical protein